MANIEYYLDIFVQLLNTMNMLVYNFNEIYTVWKSISININYQMFVFINR